MSFWSSSSLTVVERFEKMPTMSYTKLSEGFVTHRPEMGPTSVAAGSRAVELPGGDWLCSCMLSSGLGINDFKPYLFRSRDQGGSWQDLGPVWPHLVDHWSIFASLSRDAAGNCYLFGSRTPIDTPGENFWSEATQGLKPNELIWARSTDGGATWTEPNAFPLPEPGAAEAPGALCVLRSGVWIAPYSPYPTFDPALTVDRHQVVVVRSADEGRTWTHAAMLRFADPTSNAAEAWCVELADGRLLGTAWHMHPGGDYPNAYALSRDGGATWSPTRSTGIQGQSTALAALPDGRGLFIYNQRKHGEPGVRLALVRPSEGDFGIEHDDYVWQAQTRTQHDSSGEHREWSDFSFGEPSVAPLADGSLLITLWCIQPDGRGIRWLRAAPPG
jgi:hypothetical protein